MEATAELDSLLTYILHIDLRPNRLSLAWQRLNRIDLLEDLLMNVLGTYALSSACYPAALSLRRYLKLRLCAL